jgi:hypothetical protein
MSLPQPWILKPKFKPLRLRCDFVVLHSGHSYDSLGVLLFAESFSFKGPSDGEDHANSSIGAERRLLGDEVAVN